MKSRFIIDLPTGLVARSLAGQIASDDVAASLTAGDTMDCEVVFTASGEDVTAATLAGGVIAVLGLRAVPGIDPLLALSTPISLTGEIGLCTFDLHTAEIMTLIATLGTKISTKVSFEAVVGGLTVAQVRMTLRREVIAEGDEPPPEAEASRISAAESATLAQGAAEMAANAAEATADDRLQTTSDREHTEADALATAADRAQADADAEATADDRQQTTSDREHTEADALATAADRDAAHTDRLAADAAAAATAADRIQTGLDRTAGSNSAAAAAASAGTAAAISANVRNSLAPQAGVASDGTAAANRFTWALPASCALGTDPRGFSKKIETPAAAPASTQVIFTWGDAASPTTQFYELAHTSGDALRFRIYGATTADYRERTFAGFISNYGAMRAVIITAALSSAGLVAYINGVAVTLTAETTGGTAPADWQAALTSTVAAFHGGLAYKLHSWFPLNFDPSLADALDIFFLGGGVPQRMKWGRQNQYVSDFSAGLNGWSNANNNVTSGAAIAPDATSGCLRTYASGGFGVHITFRGSGAQACNLGQSARFKWSQYLPSAMTNVRYTSFTLSNNGPGSSWTLLSGSTANGASFDQWQDLVLNLRVNSSGLANPEIRFTLFNGAFSQNFNGANSPTDDVAFFKNMSWSPLGALFFVSPHASGDGCGYQLHDIGSNQVDGLMPTAGWSWTHPTPRGYVRGTLTWAGTHEGKSLLGQRAFPDGFVLGTVTLKPTASTSGSGSTLGTSNSATRWRGLTALTANTKAVATLANQLPAGTANGDADLVLDPDTANYTGSISLEAHYAVTLGT